ncbi:hypothetical protein BJK30_26130 [Escherichia coli]|nr:hypothetical protein BJK30_26130 [Escherichia coli]
MKHTDIRAAVLDALEQHEHGATLFDGRPVVFDEDYTVDYSGVTGLLVQVARESDDRITALEEENAELRQRLSAIEAALASK